ncbi:hypothetical protein HK104_001694 [Borealophlyctis nickersoniae]|nr:hypothetical protein HK104_001694 [Borealophlyctis nickersoniae]
MAGDGAGPRFKPEKIATLIHYVEERRRVEIRRTKLKLPYPWTDDRVLSKFRFCCVRREDDAVSRVLAHIFKEGNPRTDPYFFFNVVFHRHISKIEFNRDAGYIRSLKCAQEKVKAWIRTRKTWRTRSFQACCTAEDFLHGLEGNWKQSISMWKKLFRKGPRPSQKEIYHWLLEEKNKFANVGDFHAFQGACDAVMYGAAEFDPDFVMAGPGAKQGLRYLEGRSSRELNKKYPKKGDYSAEALIKDLTATLNCKLEERRMEGGPKDVLREKEVAGLRMVDVEHALCELQKYARGKRRNPTGLRKGRWDEGAGGTVSIIGEVELDTGSALTVEGLHPTSKRKLTSPVYHPSAKKRKISQPDVQNDGSDENQYPATSPLSPLIPSYCPGDYWEDKEWREHVIFLPDYQNVDQPEYPQYRSCASAGGWHRLS